jgi:hypothetical protein
MHPANLTLAFVLVSSALASLLIDALSGNGIVKINLIWWV